MQRRECIVNCSQGVRQTYMQVDIKALTKKTDSKFSKKFRTGVFVELALFCEEKQPGCTAPGKRCSTIAQQRDFVKACGGKTIVHGKQEGVVIDDLPKGHFRIEYGEMSNISKEKAGKPKIQTNQTSQPTYKQTTKKPSIPRRRSTAQGLKQSQP